MLHDTERSTFKDAAPIPTPPSNVVPLHPERASKATKAKQLRKPVERKYLWSNAARRDENLTDNAQVVAWYLGGLFDADEEAAFATHATIASETGRSIDKVKRAIRELEAKGYLWREIGAGKIGQNKYRPRWAKLSEVPVARREVPLEGCKDALPGGADSHGEECKDAREGGADLPPIIQAEYQREDKPENKRETNEAEAAASTPDRPRDASQDGPASNPRRFIPPAELGEAYARIVHAFDGNSDGDHSRAVALVLMKGYTVEQIIARIQPHNDRLATMADGRLHLLKFLREEFDFDGRLARETSAFIHEATQATEQPVDIEPEATQATITKPVSAALVASELVVEERKAITAEPEVDVEQPVEPSGMSERWKQEDRAEAEAERKKMRADVDEAGIPWPADCIIIPASECDDGLPF